MGWSNSELFDKVLDTIMPRIPLIDVQARQQVLREIYEAFSEFDFDTPDESKYWAELVIAVPTLEEDNSWSEGTAYWDHYDNSWGGDSSWD